MDFLKPRSTLIFESWSDSIFKILVNFNLSFAFLHSRSAGEPLGISASVISRRWSAPVLQAWSSRHPGPSFVQVNSNFCPSQIQVWTMVNRSLVKHSLVNPVTVIVRTGISFLFGQHRMLNRRMVKTPYLPSTTTWFKPRQHHPGISVHPRAANALCTLQCFCTR